MPSIAEIRQQAGDAYSDMSDDQLGNAIYNKFYSDMPRAEFNQKMGLAAPEQSGAGGAALRGVPVLGAYVPKAEAAIRATMQPITGVGAPGETWSERYAANVPQREEAAKQFDVEHPYASEALKIGGGTAALAPVGATALGARALGLSGGLPTRIAAGAASGAGLSGADTLARGGSPEQVLEAGKFGGAVGGIAAPVAAGISRIVTPAMQSDPVRRAAVATLERAGVTPNAGDVIGNRPVQWAEQHLGELAGRGPQQAYEQLTGAAIRNAGFEGATRATPEVVDRAFNRVGTAFDDIAARNALPDSRQLATNLEFVARGYADLVGEGNRVGAVRNYIQEIADQFRAHNNTLPGDIYQNLTSRLEKTAKATSQQEARDALRSTRAALDSAMEDHLVASGSPDAGRWQALRNQYRNLLVLEDAAGNSQTKLGIITPNALYQANKRIQGLRNVARGRGEITPLAQAASDIMRPLPSSGTSQRSYWQNLPTHIGAGAIGGAIYGQGDPYTALGGAAAGLSPLMIGRAITSRPAQAYLRNQLLPTAAAHNAFRGGVEGGLLSLLPQLQGQAP